MQKSESDILAERELGFTRGQLANAHVLLAKAQAQNTVDAEKIDMLANMVDALKKQVADLTPKPAAPPPPSNVQNISDSIVNKAAGEVLASLAKKG